MQEEKHTAALQEVHTYIDESLKSGDLLHRQRLLMTALSLGMQHVVELWLHRSRAIKPGATVKHEFFKSEERKLTLKLAGMLTKNMNSLKNASAILSLAREIERNRDDIIYGAPLPNDRILREKIDYFLELKKAVKEAVGDVA
ncbi:MAG: hypothetical protein HYY37_02625 [Candidatus Aenigmarchaeota archaeon]|nr:hypothetical protein [Candidatus Aenigmarchaeota archaeon]